MISAIFLILILGLIAWFVRSTPIPEPFKTGILVLLIVLAVLVLAAALGHPVSGVRL